MVMMKNLKNKELKLLILEMVMFICFVTIILLLIIKLGLTYQERMDIKPIGKEEVIEHNYDEPKDLYTDTTLTEKERQYYEHLYNTNY